MAHIFEVILSEDVRANSMSDVSITLPIDSALARKISVTYP